MFGADDAAGGLYYFAQAGVEVGVVVGFAFAKALGTGLRGFALNEVEVLRDALGKPYFALSGRAAARAEGLVFSLSLTHDGGYAAAFVVAERNAAK